MAKVTLEKGEDGKYSAYSAIEDLPYGLTGEGRTVKETVDDFLAAYEDMRKVYEAAGDPFPEAEFTFCYDIPSFLQYYAYAFSLAGLERVTGVNQKQLGHYISGYRRPSEKTKRKIEAGIRAFSEELSALRFL